MFVNPAVAYVVLIAFVVVAALAGEFYTRWVMEKDRRAELLKDYSRLYERNQELYQTAMLRGALLAERDEDIAEYEQIVAQLDKDVLVIKDQEQVIDQLLADREMLYVVERHENELQAEIERLEKEVQGLEQDLQAAQHYAKQDIAKLEAEVARLTAVGR